MTNNFNILRLVFALHVLIFHSALIFGIKTSFIPNGGKAVECFFVISGYLIFASYERSKSLKDYFTKRAKRIAPAVYVLTALCVILGIFLTKLPLNEYFSKSLLKFTIANLSFVNFTHPRLPGVFEGNPEGGWVNGSLWSLKIEIIFYIMVPIVLYFFRKRPILGITLSFIVSSLFKLFCIRYSNTILSNFPEVIKITLFGPSYSPFATVTFFLCGGFLYYTKNYIERFHKTKINKVAFCITAFMCLYFHQAGKAHQLLDSVICGFYVIYFAIYFPLKIHISEKIGDLSYGVYIYHFPIIQTLISTGFVNKYGTLNSITLVVVLTLILSFLSWHLIEKRFLVKKQVKLKYK